MNFMIHADETVNLFDIHNTDCLFEIMFLGILPDVYGKSLGKVLCEYSIELARELKNGKSLEILPESLRDKRPAAATAIFTSNYSQAIGAALNFQIHNKISYDDYEFNGKKFSERIAVHKAALLESFIL